jgi:translation elongation factor P/translation initiation factor 5A
MNNKKELFEQYKKSKKKFKNQLKFIKDGLSVESVKTLDCAILRKIEKK